MLGFLARGRLLLVAGLAVVLGGQGTGQLHVWVLEGSLQGRVEKLTFKHVD